MTSRISTIIVLVSILILFQDHVSEGKIGDVCDQQNACQINNTEVCGSSGQCECQGGFSPIVGQCVKECPSLDDIPSGSVTIRGNDETNEFEAIYACVSGYELEGQPRRRCLSTGNWEGSPPSCKKIACPSLDQPVNGQMRYSDNIGEFGSTANYTCVEGFEISGGDNVRNCQADGQWSGIAPNCSQIDNPCDPNPCLTPVGGKQYECVSNVTDSSMHVCICPVGKKGSTCSEDDPPISCRDTRRKYIYFEKNPTIQERTVCMPKTNSLEENVCYNPDEGIVYEFDGATDVTVDDSKEDRFCLTYTNTAPIEAEDCVNITVFEADDKDYRPWINDSFHLCFQFNREPRIMQLNRTLVYNVLTMPATWTVPLVASDIDNQTFTLTVSGVGRSEFADKFSIVDDNLQVTNPVEIYESNSGIFGDTFTVEITAKDDGVPQLEDSMEFNVEFVHEQLICRVPGDPFLVHLDPEPTNKLELGQIECTDGAITRTPVFEIINNAGPAIIEADGKVFYDPTATETKGNFRINVRANTTLTVPVATTFQFTLFAANFEPRCNPTDLPRLIPISEKAVTGTCSGITFICDDPANVTKTCTDTSDLFDVSCDTVSSNITEMKVCTADSLDRLAGSSEKVSVEVQNEYGVHGINVTVSITNVNDPPKFVSNNTQIDIVLSEDTAVPSVLDPSAIPVADPDTEAKPPFDNLTATITDLENKQSAEDLPFTAEVNSFGNAVTVTLAKALNPKLRHSYILELKVEDTSGESDTLDLNITIKDVNEKPTCGSQNVNTSATVRDAVDYVVTRLTCTDNDFSEAFRSLTYSLEGDTSTTDYFKIDSSGVVQLQKSLNSFTSGTVLSFTARVTDGGGLSETVQVTVDVITSYPPECGKQQVTQTKSERTASGDCFQLSVDCRDPVQNKTLTFRDPSGNGTQLFSLQVGSTTNALISLCTTDSLQGKVGEWHINLVVESSYGSRNIQIILKVEDENDAPKCSPKQKDLKASAKDTTDTDIFSPICSDPDVDTNFKTLTYTLEGQADVISYFKIDTGGIKLAKPLSDISGSDNVLTFTVRAEDGGGLFDTIAVAVTVDNDFPPTCNKTEFEIVISEATNADVCLFTKLGCTDTVRDETLQYKNISGNGTAVFYEKGSTNAEIKLCTSGSLQGKYGDWEIKAVVSSSYGERSLKGIIRVSDKNDKPEFMSSSYSQNVYENTTENTELLTVVATDQDSGIYGKLIYQSKDMDDSVLFKLNKDTGVISVASTLDADTSDTKLFTFVVEAIDGAPVPLSASTTVSIEVLDVNDEKPVCDPTTLTVDIYLLDPLDTVVTQLGCSDADITPDFQILRYVTTSSYFSVNSTGHVTLTSKLPRDVTQHKVDVKVTDSDKSSDPDFSTNVVITVNVDNNVPPECSAVNVVGTLKETEEIGVCLDKEVICTDPTGGEVTLQSESGTAKDKDLLEMRIHSETGKLGLSACVKSSLKDKFGKYELIGTVTNGLGTTTVTWTFTVVNVNESPVFTPDNYNIQVSENQTMDTEILKITVSDPDNGKGNPDFELDYVTEKSTNDEDFNGDFSDRIIFLKAVRSFYSYRPFNATRRNVYKYNVTAVDKSGLNATAQVRIEVLDVNSEPVCSPTSLQSTLNILAKENEVVVTMFCYDTDIEAKNIELDYEIIDGDVDGYFNVTGNGELILLKKLPRDELLYGVGKANVRVKVSDRGTPPLETFVTASVTIDRNIPATCKPAFIPPNVWIQNACVTIKMDCTDPTQIGTDHLKYTTSGNFTRGFTEKSNSLGTIELCYNLIISGVFQISVVVDNGLSKYTFTDNIVVSYSQATPVFSKPKYTQTISENTATGTTVLVVELDKSSADLIKNLEYSVLGSGSTEGWNTYFTLDGTNGEIKTLTSIKELADQVITLKVEAVDKSSQLRSSVLVELTIQDENERPTCTITSTKLNIEVDEAVDTPIIVFSCNDPDVKEEYRTLTYDISGDNVDVYFKFVGSPATSVVIKEPLNILTFEYVITMTVSDKGTPPLSFSRNFLVNVNTLPPPVDVVAVATSFDTINVSWDYARPDYYDVTNSFNVKALSTANVIVKNSPTLDSSTRTYNITGLSAVTKYIIVVEANTNDGTRASDELTVTTNEVPVLTNVTVTMIAKKDYNERLRDTLSQIYYEYRNLVVDSVMFALRGVAGVVGISDVSFRPYNSIYVDMKVMLNQSADPAATIQRLNQTVSSGWVQQLSVQSNFFQAAVGAGYILIDGLSFTPTEVYNGTEIVLECNITTVGYLSDEVFEYWWTYRGNRLYPTDQSRYGMSSTTGAEFYEYKHSILRVNPILGDQSGFYGCHVSDKARRQVKEKLIELRVISQPTVYITPKSQTLRYDENVNVTCELVISPGTFEQFVWYKNGSPFLKGSNEILTSTGTSMTITTIGIKENVVYGCEGKNEAGNSVRVFSNIGVIPQDANNEDLCPASDDNRGTMWPLTAPDTVVRLGCATGFTGEIYRECSANGDWKLPVYDCVSEKLETIEQKFKDIQDGVKESLNLTEALIDLNKETAGNTLLEGDIDTAINSLDIAVGINDSVTPEEKEIRKSNFLETCSSLIDDPNTLAWLSSIEVRRKGAISIPRLVEQYNIKALESIADDKEETSSVKNIHVTVGAGKRELYSFPDKSSSAPDWVKSSKTGIVVQGEAFKDIPTVHFASSVFRNITPILAKKLKKDGTVTDISSTYDINSDIVVFQLKESVAKVDPPAEITFEHFSSNYSDPICCYWDFDAEAFVTDGCVLVSTSDEFTVCQCNHFTNFAVLMSPGKTPEADVMALSIISAVGCAISILCLLLTIIFHAIVWRFVKSDRAVLLINLCVALIIAYVVFIAGVDRVENKDVCTAISVLLHYFYLAVFFLMLAYGIEIAVCVVYVFVTRSRIKWLLPLAWGIPLLIVGISMGATQLDGYGNESFCWLSIDDGLLWAFVGPAALIILINFIIVVVVLKQMFKSSVMMTKSDKEKAITGVRSICVLLPILGLTWVFGVFSVNEDLVAFQYIFAICNSLQGFFIFLFHCVLNKQLRQALKQRSERKKSLQSIENSLKNQHSTTGSTAFVSNDNKLAQNNDLYGGSSNPFLEADRQMKELVGKNKKTGKLNDNLEANNKVEVDKSSKAVDLDDVKISNIIRESEVMGGTTGISSILPADNRTEDEKINETPVIRSSMASSHRYDYIDQNQTGSQTSTGIEKPPGYEKLLQGTGFGTDRSREREKEKQKEKEREKERERERERQKKIEKEKQDRMEKERIEREREIRENEERERLERERLEREKRERDQREKDRHQDRGVIRIGYTNEGYTVDKRRSGSQERRGQPRSARSSRTDDDYEQKEAKKQSDSLKKKEKKKSSLKDRSKAYEYSYDSTYLGGSSRHSSLENMNMQHLGPYAQAPGYGGYQTGRPAVQQQHWDQYGYARDPRDRRDPRDYDPYSRDPYRRDYW